MPSGIFVIDFSGKSVLFDLWVLNDIDVSEEKIVDFLTDVVVEAGAVQRFSMDGRRILCYAIAEDEKRSLLGLILLPEEDEALFETALIEEAEPLLRRKRGGSFSSEVKLSYQSIIQKVIEGLEERMAEVGKEREEKEVNIKNFEEELEKLYAGERELLAELEKGVDTDSTIEKIEAVITKQKQFEELIQINKNLKKTFEEKEFNLRNERMKLQEIHNRIDELTPVQSLIAPGKEKEEEPEEKAPEQVEVGEAPVLEDSVSGTIAEASPTSTLPTSHAELVSEEGSLPVESESPTVGVEKTESTAGTLSSQAPSVLESESVKTMFDFFAERVGSVKAAIIEYLFWMRKPRTISEISQDLETPAEKIREHSEGLANSGYVCRITKKRTEEIYLTVCPSCPLRARCEKKRVVDWDKILSETRM
ncbi:MAG: hypothetical protein Q6352_010155 [Candidatus Freyrarchaeum guaymaensis]